TWVDQDFNAGTYQVMMRYFSSAGTPLTGIVPVTPPSSLNIDPDVAASNGSFVISWTHPSGATDDDIDAERFVVANDVPTGQGIFVVKSDANQEGASSVAMSPSGAFDIAYQRQFSGVDWDIFASQYSSSGSLLRGDIHINFDALFESDPSV